MSSRAMKLYSCKLSRTRKGHLSRHQKSICDGGIRLSRYFRFYVTLSFLVFHVFPAARSNPQLLRSGRRSPVDCHLRKRPATAPSFRRMSWNWIAGFSQRGEQMASRNGYERTRGYISEKTFLLFSFALSFVSSCAAYCVFPRAFRVSRYLKKVYEFLSADRYA